MSEKYAKLAMLLKELFLLDQPDLDFGLFRIMHAKSVDVIQFLEETLMPEVKEMLDGHLNLKKQELKKELSDAVAQAQDVGVNPEDALKVQKIQRQLNSVELDVSRLESEVYEHLYRFFRRYYSKGDFLTNRVYKPGVYAIPYEGEEVILHWANKDQYYIKTSEYLSDYVFCLKPNNDKNPMRVNFRLASVTEGAHGNAKASVMDKRVFVLPPIESNYDFLYEEDGEQAKELVILFDYRTASLTDYPETELIGRSRLPNQKQLIRYAVKRILEVKDEKLIDWIDELKKAHIKANGEHAEYSRLEAHLRRFTARNTFDYFIHKDLGKFLRQELDFYIKNEVIHLDDLYNEYELPFDKYHSKIKTIYTIASKIIKFLSQIEDFQKKLWLKKKFVVETNYCITLDRVPEKFYSEIAANEAQQSKWKNLFAIDELTASDGDLLSHEREELLNISFLKENPFLVLDTELFDECFKHRLISEIDKLDEQVDGLLIHAENFQALNLLQKKHRRSIKCIYIDPPYNTGDDNFVYKDNYRHSSWLTMMNDRIRCIRDLVVENSSIAISINEEELFNLKLLMDEVYGEENYVTSITVKVRHDERILKADKDIHETTEHLLVYRHSQKFTPGKKQIDNTSVDEYVWNVGVSGKPFETKYMGDKKVKNIWSGTNKIT